MQSYLIGAGLRLFNLEKKFHLDDVKVAEKVEDQRCLCH